jgi:MFS family permease
MGAYLDILRHPRMAALLGSALIARLPIGLNGLAIVLFLREQTGSFSVPGAVAGGMALGIGFGAPVMGRLVDRRGPRVLLALASANATGVLTLLALGSSGAPVTVLVAVAAMTGAFYPPTPSVLRARFPELLRSRPELVASAYALDSVLLELTFVLAPLAVAVVVAVVEPGAALVVSACAVLVGVSAFVVMLPPEARVGSDGESPGLLGALRAPGIHTLVLTMLPVGFAIGALEVAMPAFSHDQSHAELAGVLLAIWAMGSAAGGLIYGARPRRSPLHLVHLRLTLLLPLAFLPLAVAPSSLLVMAVLLLPAGALIAPIIATRNELASEAAPPGTKTEALTWPLTALVAGLALGAAVGGALIDGSGWRAAALAAVLSAAAGGLVATARRETMRTAVVPARSLSL